MLLFYYKASEWREEESEREEPRGNAPEQRSTWRVFSDPAEHWESIIYPQTVQMQLRLFDYLQI